MCEDSEMTVTSIEPRRGNKSALYIDGEFTSNINDEVFANSHIKIGDVITVSRLNDIIGESNFLGCKEKAINLLSFRDHSKKELVDKIKRKYDIESAQKAANKMEELGLVDDRKFAEKYALELLNVKGFAKSRIELELLKKGIDREIISDVLENLEVCTEEQIKKLIDKKFKRKLLDDKGKKQVYNSLMRMGYHWSDAHNAIEKECTEN